jgi:hypothetical protein
VRGDCQREFAEAAAEDGIELGKQSFPWLSERGHLALTETPNVAATLERIYRALGGDLDVLATARSVRLRGDFIHVPSGTLIEVDESQHFTSARLTTLDLYPADAACDFDVETYKSLCREWREDGYYKNKTARGFGVGGRQRQRAYYDALRDLAAPAMGHPPLIRVDAPLRDGRAAYRTHREHLLLRLK